MTPLTLRRLKAMQSALASELAGEADDDELDREDYEAALRWVQEQIAKRERR